MPLDNQYFKEPLDFITGSIQSVGTKDGDFGKQIVVEMLPVGETVNRLIFFNADKALNRNSGWQRWIRSFKNVGLTLSSANDLEGKFFTFQLVMQHFTIEGKEIDKDFWKPVALYSTENDAVAGSIEWAEKANTAGAMKSEEASTTPVSTPAPAQPQFAPEMLAAASTIYDSLGKNDTTFEVVIAQSYPKVDVKALLATVKAK